MEKRSDVSRDSRTGIKKPKSDKVELEELTVSKEVERVWVRKTYPINITRAGQSGESYVFNGPGAEVKVRVEDVETLLAEQRGGCCGAASSFVFELVK